MHMGFVLLGELHQPTGKVGLGPEILPILPALQADGHDVVH